MDTIAKRRVLILEDDPTWVQIYRKMMPDTYSVTLCTTLDEAIEALYQQSYHLIIVDLQLNDDNKNREGKRLLSRLRSHYWIDKAVVVVISGVHEIRRIEDINEILEYSSQDSDKLQRGLVIQDILFFTKDGFNTNDPKALKEHIEHFLEYVDRLSKRRRLDGQVEIMRPDILESLSQRVFRNLKDLIETNRIAEYDSWLNSLDDTTLQNRIRQEIYDLLQMSFRHADSILLTEIGDGFSKASVVKVTLNRNGQFGRSRIVKLGYHSEIQQEFDCFDEYVDYFLDKHPEGRAGGRTPLLQSILYRELNEVVSFEEVFLDKDHWSIEQLEAAVDGLFRDCCGNWYHGKNDEFINYGEVYPKFLNWHPTRFDESLKHLDDFTNLDGVTYLDSKRIRFDGIEVDFPNPIHIFKNTGKMDKLVLATKECITHGDFNANNIFFKVNNEKGAQKLEDAWLIDFYRTGPHHAFRDFIQLETVIKFFLLKDATLPERYELEQMLIKPRYFRDLQWADVNTFKPISPNSLMLIRAFRIIQKIRTLSWELVLNLQDHQNLGHFKQYNMGLFFLSLNSVRFVRTETMNVGINEIQSLHALMASAILADKLNLS